MVSCFEPNNQRRKRFQSIKDTAQNLFINPFTPNDLLCISNGSLATEAVKSDLLGALQKGKDAMQTFIDDRLDENAAIFPANKEDEIENLHRHEENQQSVS